MQMANKITDRKFWQDYWRGYQPKLITTILFQDIFASFPSGNQTFIEIGGFPGNFSIYFRKFKKYQVTMLDYFVDYQIISQALKINSLDQNAIRIIEVDFFDFQSDKQYDIVFSAGFIEHFDNPEIVVKKHLELLKPGGLLFISLPNFLGLNGFVQKIFDKKNLTRHNTEIMKIEKLNALFNAMDLTNYKISYWGKPSIWLESSSGRSKSLIKAIKAISKILNLLNLKNKFLSPYLVVQAYKK